MDNLVYIIGGSILGWMLCGVLAYGLTFADFQRSFPNIAKERYKEHKGIARVVACMGPIGVIVSFLGSGGAPHGLKWK